MNVKIIQDLRPSTLRLKAVILRFIFILCVISPLPTDVYLLGSVSDVNLLCKFALLENQHGFSEQSQTLFEHILTSYPKRTDIWSVYVDMLVKSDKLDVARYVPLMCSPKR